MPAEKISYCLAGFDHVFHKGSIAHAKPAPMLHQLANLPVGTADGDIFKRAAKAAHAVPFKMRQHHHAVIIYKAFAYGHFFKMPAAADWQHHSSMLVHNIYRAEIPAVGPDCFAVALRSAAPAAVGSVGFYNYAAGNLLLHRLDKAARQKVSAALLARMYFYGYFAFYLAFD